VSEPPAALRRSCARSSSGSTFVRVMSLPERRAPCRKLQGCGSSEDSTPVHCMDSSSFHCPPLPHTLPRTGGGNKAASRQGRPLPGAPRTDPGVQFSRTGLFTVAHCVARHVRTTRALVVLSADQRRGLPRTLDLSCSAPLFSRPVSNCLDLIPNAFHCTAFRHSSESGVGPCCSSS
jgi:hypothetical protein